MTYEDLVSENKNVFIIARVVERDALNNPIDFELLATDVNKKKAMGLYESFKKAFDDVLFMPVFNSNVLGYTIFFSSELGLYKEEHLTASETAEFFRHYYGL